MSKYPSYLRLYETGELFRRVEKAWAMLEACSVCPRQCKINRLKGEKGVCRTGLNPLVASVCDHHGEEPVISGIRGSGTVFLGQCNLRCVYCQNWQISQPRDLPGFREISPEQLAHEIVGLQNQKLVHNINFVSPSSWVPQILRTVEVAISLGLKIPLVYNTNAFDSLESLALLDGIFDIYLPDMKYGEFGGHDKLYSGVESYACHSRNAVAEMWRQVGEPVIDADGVVQKGLVIRHLILPHGISGMVDTFQWIRRVLGKRVWISLMSQYYPTSKAEEFPLLVRRILKGEYEEAVALLDEMEFDRGYVQPLDSKASEYYRPDFEREHPFEH